MTAVAILPRSASAPTPRFARVNSLLLRPLPVDPQRLVILDRPGTERTNGYTTFDASRRHAAAFDGAMAWSLGGTSLVAYGGETGAVEHHFVSGDYFSTLGVRPLVGRTITPADDVEGGGTDGPAIMISYGLWQRRFGGVAAVVGARVIVDRLPVTVVGVTPPDFFGPVVGRGFDIALPIKIQPLVQPSTLTDQ